MIIKNLAIALLLGSLSSFVFAEEDWFSDIIESVERQVGRKIEYTRLSDTNSCLVFCESKPIGCIYRQISWKKKDFTELFSERNINLSQIDLLTYGYHDDLEARYRTADPAIINRIIQTYTNHTYELIEEHCFVPFPQENLPEIISDLKTTYSHGCTLAIRLFREGELVYGFGGHIEDPISPEDTEKNYPLHLLMKHLLENKSEQIK